MGARVAGWTGIACAVHCCAAPVLLAVSPSLELSEAWEWGFFFFALVMALAGTLKLYVIVGLAIWFLSLCGVFEAMLPEVVTTTVGAVIFAVAMLREHHHHKKACRCDDSADPPNGER